MTITASLVHNTCYPSVVAAVDAYFSTMPVVLTPGITSYKIEHLQVAGVWNMRGTSIDNLGNATINYTVAATAPTFPNCDPTEAYFDGMAIGWGVVGAMVSAFSVIFIKKTFFR